jgi:hypothetical protein
MATVQCGIGMRLIAIRTTLWYTYDTTYWYQVGDSGTVNYYGYAYGQAVASTPCGAGWYQGFGQAYVEPPPGYVPTSATISQWGNVLYVTC